MWHGLTMRADAKEAWVTALRSGEYEQMESALCLRDKRGNKSYCCLGVFAKVMGVNARVPPGNFGMRDQEFYFKVDGRTIKEKQYLPHEWFGQFLDFKVLESEHDNKQEAIAYLTAQFVVMNDCKNLSFPEIANWIEGNL